MITPVRRLSTHLFTSAGLIAALLMAGAVAGCSNPDEDRRIALAIRKQVAQPFRWFRRATVDDDDIQQPLRNFYKARAYRAAWTHPTGPTSEARDLLQELKDSPTHGLRPEDYDFPRLEEMMKGLDQPIAVATEGRAARLAALDVELSRSFLKYATHRSAGVVNPLQLPADWHIRPRKVDAAALLADALEHHRIAANLEQLDPKDPQYGLLRRALTRYRDIEAKGGWSELPGGAPLKRGQSGARVAQLQQRLAAEGDFGGGSASGRFDGATEAAVRAFQERHGLDADGVVGNDEIQELNFPITHRIRQIELNLERHRWVPDSLMSGRYAEVNLPAFALRVVDNGRAVLGMRVVVGKQFSPTPMFSDEISYLVFNPKWNVPAKIAGQEILAEVQKDPDYLAKNDMHLYENEGEAAHEIDPASVDWQSLTPETFRYAVRQNPGPENPVGHVKFMCPNQFDVYLHDTPAGHLFTAEERGFSHGCIRVERPVELAEYLLRDKPQFSREGIAAAFDTSDNRSVAVTDPLPVHIVYWTAFVDDRGRVQFRDDFYGLDSLLDRTLRSKRPNIPSTVRTSAKPASRPTSRLAFLPRHG